jgi:hypothetical protein
VSEAIARLAYDFVKGDKSVNQLVRESGYRERRAGINVEAIAECLRAHPQWVDAWFDYPDWKGPSDGWVIERSAEGFSVWRFESDGRPFEVTERHQYGDRVTAAANYAAFEAASVAQYAYWSVFRLAAEIVAWIARLVWRRVRGPHF